MKKLSLMMISVLMASAVAQAQEVRKVSVGDTQNHGVTYTLPKVKMNVEAVAVCTTIKAGVFAQYAEKYLGIADAPQEDLTEWSISGVTMTPVAVPDTSRTFHVIFSEKGPLPTFYLDGDGSMLSINRAPEMPKKAADAEDEVAEEDKKFNGFNVMSEELIKAGSKAKQAEIAARQIYRIRESRLNLLTGDVDNLPADGASFQLILDNLKSQEEAYLELFTGVRTEEKKIQSYEYVPAGEDKGTVLFRFSKHFGFVDADDLSGEPYQIAVTLLEDNRMPAAPTVDEKGKKLPAPTGIAFCVPGKARVALKLKTGVVASGDFQMGQFGHIERLERTHFLNKKAPASAAFNAMTGAITMYVGE